MKFIPRTVFPKYNVPLANLKGHQRAALSDLMHLAPQIDYVLEVRDARAPLASANGLIDKVLAKKPKMVLYNKLDLAVTKPKLIEKFHKERNEDCMFLSAKNTSDVKKLVSRLQTKFGTYEIPPPLGFRVAIVGMPNVGKSSMINSLRQIGMKLRDIVTQKKYKVARTSDYPGLTRKTSEAIKISEDPLIYIYDAPGIMVPSVKDAETMISLALIHSVQSELVDHYIQADYLLYLLNLQNPSGKHYRKFIDHPTNSVDELLVSYAKKSKNYQESKFNIENTARNFVDHFRVGYKVPFAMLEKDTLVESLEKWNDILKTETNRLNESPLIKELGQRLGDDYSGMSKNRKRNAKDRKADLNNMLFKL